jgi:hypothetical protein
MKQFVRGQEKLFKKRVLKKILCNFVFLKDILTCQVL